MMRLGRLVRQKEFHLFIFCLQIMLIEWPFLSVFTGTGLQSLFVYLFTLWALFIIILFLLQKPPLDERSDRGRDNDGDV